QAHRHVVAALAVVHAEVHPVGEAELAHAAGAGERKDDLLARFLRQLEDGVGAARVVDHLGVGAGLEAALQVERDAALRVQDVDGLERHRRRAAQMEPAACKRQDEEGGERSQTTRFTSRPGTTTTFFTLCPATNFCTLALARARPSMAARSAAFGTRIEPRSLPFTCTTSSISSCSSAAASGSGHGARITSSPKPSSVHRRWLMCGAMGESRRRRIEKPSREVALHSSARSSALRIFLHADATVLNWWRCMS